LRDVSGPVYSKFILNVKLKPRNKTVNNGDGRKTGYPITKALKFALVFGDGG
jgi:hypothetical protein